MKKRALLAVLTAAILCGGTAVFSANTAAQNAIYVNAQAETDFPCSYEARPVDTEYMCYGSSEVIHYTADEAASAGVPAGYENDVLKVVPIGASAGVFLDFSAYEIPVFLLKSLEFRVFIETNAANTGSRPQLRIAKPNAVNSAWVHQPGDTPTPSGEWTTVSVEKNNHFSSITNEKGYLNKFELSVRSNVKIPFYIDKISYTLVENDGAAPIITYNGEDEITTSVGADFTVNVSAFDAQESRSIEVERAWSAGALDEDGNLTVGTHTLTLTATDYFGNKAEKIVMVNVCEPDVEAPVIHMPESIYAEVGSIFLVNMPITDNREVASVTSIWSDGALDEDGKLVEGTHTLTVIAVDTSGNKTEKVATVYVTNDGNGNGEIVDEEELTRPEDSDTDSDTTSDTTSDTDSETTSDTTSDTDSETTSDTTSDTDSDTTSDTTSDATSETPNKPNEDKKSGCGSAIGFSALGGLAFIGAAFSIRKKKET